MGIRRNPLGERETARLVLLGLHIAVPSAVDIVVEIGPTETAFGVAFGSFVAFVVGVVAVAFAGSVAVDLVPLAYKDCRKQTEGS